MLIFIQNRITVKAAHKLRIAGFPESANEILVFFFSSTRALHFLQCLCVSLWDATTGTISFWCLSVNLNIHKNTRRCPGLYVCRYKCTLTPPNTCISLRFDLPQGAFKAYTVNWVINHSWMNKFTPQTKSLKTYLVLKRWTQEGDDNPCVTVIRNTDHTCTAFYRCGLNIHYCHHMHV